MIRYRQLYESEEIDLRLYDIVSCAGYDWYVIDIKGDVVTILAKNDDFGKSIFDSHSNDYGVSEISLALRTIVLPKLKREGIKPVPTDLPDVDCHGDEIWLLSTDEAKKLPRQIRQFPTQWWLRSQGWIASYAANVSRDGGINNYGDSVVDVHNTVRPAMRVHVEDLD